MDDVVTAVGLLVPDAVDLIHHLVQQGGKLFLGQFAARAGHHVVDADSRPGMFDGGLPGSGGTGEDLHLNAHLGQRHGQRPHIDVHAAGITCARLFHGGGVQRQECDAADHWHRSPPALMYRGNSLQKTLLLRRSCRRHAKLLACPL